MRPLTVSAILTLSMLLPAMSARADDWPQWLGPQRDGVWRETGILDTFPKEGPKVRWRTPIGLGYSGPAVVGTRVYITDRVLGENVKNPPSGFGAPTLEGKERVHCLDEANGKVLWSHEYPCTYTKVGYPAGPRCTPIVQQGKVFTLGTMGDLVCLDAETGKPLWSKSFIKDFNAPTGTWGHAAHPLLDGNRLICLVGGKGSCVVAFDRDNGKEIWRALDGDKSKNRPGYAPPIIVEAGGKRQLIVWHPEGVSSLNPETGAVYWTEEFTLAGTNAPDMSVSMPRVSKDYLFVTSFYRGSMMLRLSQDRPAATVVWKSQDKSEDHKRTTNLHSIICTPFLKEGFVYGVCSYGELRCLKAESGDRLWSTRKPTTGDDDDPIRWANAFLVQHEDRCFLFNDQGDLIIARLTPKGYEELSRAHILEPTNSMANRKVVWMHPAFAHKCCYARNDKEIVCVALEQ